MRGYKAFEIGFVCRGKQYKVGETFVEEGKPVPCEHGMHFCERLADVFDYYTFDEKKTVVAEVEALGEIATDDEKKFCTDKLHIIRELIWDEVVKLCNTGSWNTGGRNTGNWNTGNRNTGNCNTGDRNTGNWNTGDRNTGDRNTGNWNTGDRNTGNWNTGDWNKSSFNNGCFMTNEPKIQMFNKASELTFREWRNSRACYLLRQIQKNVVEWVCASQMTEEEKKQHPEHETIGGYLKTLDESESAQLWWNGLPKNDRETIFAIPNFDKEIFRECTGIDVDVG